MMILKTLIAGKSTLLNFFNRFPEFAVHKEPLDQWQVGRSRSLFYLVTLSQNLSQDLNGTNFLGLVFQDPGRWGLAFESLVGSLECRISERRTPRSWPKITKRQRQWHTQWPRQWQRQWPRQWQRQWSRQWHTQWLRQWQMSECRSPWPWLRSTWPITTVRRVFSSIRSRCKTHNHPHNEKGIIELWSWIMTLW